MAETTTLGSWLRRERERRGVTLNQISEQTKLSVSMLEGLESDDLSRWPGGIFRRSFARSYATAIGLDGDLVVKRIEEEHPDPSGLGPTPVVAAGTTGVVGAATPAGAAGAGGPLPAVAPAGRQALGEAWRLRLMGAALDLLVAAAIAFGFAAAGSRLLWPVLVIAIYHALGVLLTGTTPMLAVVSAQGSSEPVSREVVAVPPPVEAAPRRAEPQQQGRRHRGRRPPRQEPARAERLN